MRLKQFEPVQITALYKLKCHLQNDWFNFNFVKRETRWRQYSFMVRTFRKLHYLGSHSYVQDKWHKVERSFLNKHRSLDL